MYQLSEITTLHLEVSSFCNARCPMCARTGADGKINPRLKQKNLKLAEIETYFPLAFLRQLKRLLLCGNFGDPAAHPQLADVIRHFKSQQPDLKIQVHSNGGLQTPGFWSELAPLVEKCYFGIDGLQDTNHLYRQGVVWGQLMSNVQAFLSHGGQAEWHFLIFRHNEHQVEAARQLAREMGFQKFQAKATSRFFGRSDDGGCPVFSTQGERLHTLYPPTQSEFQNSSLVAAQEDLAVTSWEEHWDRTAISCKVAEEKSLYISAEGEVYPCCWLGQELWIAHHDEARGSLKNFLRERGLTSQDISLQHHSLSGILESHFFQTTLPQSWQASSLSCGKLRTCARKCGESLDFFKAQFLS